MVILGAVSGRWMTGGEGRGHRALWFELGIPLAVLLAAVVADSLLPRDIIITAVFAIAPFVASALTSPARTAAIGALSVVAVGVSALWNHDVGTAEWWIRLLGGVLFAVIAVLVARMRVRRERALQHMTVVAETAQRALLRGVPARVGSVGLAARYVSATEAALVGGDLYEVADTPYGVRVVIGDVRGKGLDAVHLASTVLAAFRRAAFVNRALAGVTRDLDDAVSAVCGDEDFVTALVAEFRHDGTGAVVNCGHLPPLLLTSGRRPSRLDGAEPTPPLGLGGRPAEVPFDWPGGSRILLYTDGLVEARNRQGAFFPLDDHVAELSTGTVDEALDHLLALLRAFSAGQGDDLALVLAEQGSRVPGPDDQ